MTEAAALYRGACRLLGQAKAAGWRISLTPGGAWRVTHPGGGGLTMAPRPTMRALLAAEQGFERIQRANTEAS